MRLPIKVALICLSLLGIILGSHGVWVYFSRLELLLGGEGSKLFLAIEVPIRLQLAVVWMSVKGLQSWFIPTVFIVLGLIVWSIQSSIHVGHRIPKWLRDVW